MTYENSRAMVERYDIVYKATIQTTKKGRIRFKTELDLEDLMGRINEVKKFVGNKMKQKGKVISLEIIRLEDIKPLKKGSGIKKLKQLIDSHDRTNEDGTA